MYWHSVCGILPDPSEKFPQPMRRKRKGREYPPVFVEFSGIVLAQSYVMSAYTADAHASCAPDKAYIGDVVQMVKAEYLEMPGLCLTLAQAERLWNLDRATCVGVLGKLVESGFLWRTEAGIYERNACDLQFGSQDAKYQ